MFKKQKSKILVFLLMLGLLYGCKRQLLDPLNPQNNLPQKAQFDKVKAFYEKGRYKNQPKSSNLTSADSARFRDFEPDWDKTEVELLPNNKKMLIVPIVRYLNVSYADSLAFIRRLVISTDEQDNLLEASVVEILGNLNFVPNNYKNIFKNYKNTVISGFSGAIITHEIDYDYVLTKQYTNGNFIKNTLSQYVVANINERGMAGVTCTFGVGVIYQTEFCEIGEDHQEICYWTTTTTICNSDPNVGTVFGGNGNTPSTGTPRPPAGGTTGTGNTGVSSGPSGSTPNGGGSSGSNTPYVPPIKDTGISWEEEDNIEVEADIEENTLDPRTPREKVIFDPSLDAYPKLKCVLEAMIGTNNTDGNPTLKKMLSNVPVGERITIKTAPVPESTHLAVYKHADRSITFNSSKLAKTSNIMFALTIVHESTHGFIHNEIAIAFPTNTIASFQSGGQSYTSSNAVLQDRIRQYHAYYTTHTGGNFNNSGLAHHNIMATIFLQTFIKATMEYSGTRYSLQLSEPFRALAILNGLQRSTNYTSLSDATKKAMLSNMKFIIEKTTNRPNVGSMSERCR